MLKNYRYTGEQKLSIDKLPTDSKVDKANKDIIFKKLLENQAKMKELQDKLYADGREGIIVVLQAMDAAGKDSTIRHTLGPLNPQGVDVISFKQPSADEVAHDYLWRAHKAVPPRGKIAIFNRSYYEDVLVVKVHNLQNNYKMSKRTIDDDFFDKRYKQIKNFEEYLYDNSYRIVKIFLHVSKKEQKKRFLSRIDDGYKNWKFSSSDLKEREFFDKYMTVYEEAIAKTATKESPWYILPADQKWYTRYLVSEILVDVLEKCDPKYPSLPKKDILALEDCKEKLLNE